MLKWGIAGTGQIARAFALALNRAENCRACGVAGRRAEKAAAFAAEHRVERAYSSVEQMGPLCIEAGQARALRKADGARNGGNP